MIGGRAPNIVNEKECGEKACGCADGDVCKKCYWDEVAKENDQKKHKNKKSGDKYLRVIPTNDEGLSDIYDVLDAYEITSQPRGHAIKKALCAGIRGKGSEEQDISEAIDALMRDLDHIRRRKVMG